MLFVWQYEQTHRFPSQALYACNFLLVLMPKCAATGFGRTANQVVAHRDGPGNHEPACFGRTANQVVAHRENREMPWDKGFGRTANQVVAHQMTVIKQKMVSFGRTANQVVAHPIAERMFIVSGFWTYRISNSQCISPSVS